MIKNYLVLALRNLRKNKFFSAVNIFGLSVGLACCMLVAEYQKGVQVAQMQRSIQWLDQSLKAGLPTNVFQSMMAFNR